MAGSRKAFLRKISPFKGSGRFLQYVRCPCCGKLCRGQAIGHAGTHKLSISQCVGRRPGSRGGFDWEHVPPTPEILESLKEALEAALEQVNGLLGMDGQHVSGEAAIPALVGVVGWETVSPALVGVLGGETIMPEVFSHGDNKGESQGQGEVIYPRVQAVYV